MLAWWGIVRGGAVAVPINTAYKGDYLRHQLADSGSTVLIVEAVARSTGPSAVAAESPASPTSS